MFLSYAEEDWLDNYCLYFSKYPNYYIHNCYFRYKNWTVCENTTDAIARYSHKFISGRVTNDYNGIYDKSYFFDFQHNIIEQSGQAHCFCFSGFHEITLKDIEIYKSYSDGSVFEFGDDRYKGAYLEADNFRIYQTFSPTNETDNDYFCCNTTIHGRFNYVKFTNFHAEIITSSSNETSKYPLSVGIQEPINNFCHFRPIIDVSILGSGGEFDNITINFPKAKMLRESLIRVRQCSGYNNHSCKTPESKQYCTLQNITITTASDRYDSYDERKYYKYKNIFEQDSVKEAGAIDIRVENINSDSLNSSAYFLVQNLNLDCYAGVALYADHAIIDLENKDIRGLVNIQNCTGKIRKISSWSCSYILRDIEQNFLYIEEIEAYRNNPNFSYNADPAVVTDWSSNILCDRVNIKFMPEEFVDQAYNSCYECNYVVASEVLDGSYTVRNRLAKAQTWSVSRKNSDGTLIGAKCSIKLTNEIRDDNRYPLRLGGLPFQGIKANFKEGDQIFRVFCTTTGYEGVSSDPSILPSLISEKLLCKITLPDGKVVFSEQGCWKLDTTTLWENIDNNVSAVLEIPIKSSMAGVGYIEYFFNWFQKEAATFLDPFPEII
jgi:hypothetical protein